MSQAEARDRMREAAALWSVGYADAAEIVKAACDLLVAGYDGTALAILAGVSLRHPDQDVPDILPAALAELDLPYYEQNSTASAEAAVRTLAARVVAATLPPRELAAWAHSRFGHGTLALADRLVELDDVYDCVEYANLTDAEVDADVVAEAHRILERSPDTGSSTTR